ncbi:restriction endonuclease subunit S [Accumulibacter sp.]|uniref:restriction endonuclease subunit S n=1 Tax=Accumulibacter sp. TaxID=2053492 RepID=UPI0025E6DFE4|nr:restriction endonuclease subunit S [Accumulibacter sp.]MCM8625127.1 restriction endonuclease subunit S [Accumulibacter sp.]
MIELKPYPTMKDSGVPWLGDVPEHWGTRPLKRWVRMNAEVLPETTAPDHQFRYLDIGSVGTGVLTQKPQRLRFGTAPSRARRVVRNGDTIVSTVRTYLKAVYFVEGEADDLVCSTGFAVLSPDRDTLPKFLSYVAQSSSFTDRVTADSVGIAYPAIAETRLGSFHIAVPHLPEQAAIVRFLDHADRRIRRYIRAKQKLIKLLEEQKQAIIHSAVTRGLDPSVRLKPSGVEWLGDVPEHWEVRRVKSLSLVKRGASPRPIADPKYFDEAGEYAWVRIADVSASSRYLEKTTQRLSSLGDSLSVRLEPGALFLSIAGSVGKPMISKIKCCIHDGFVYFPQFRGNAEFLCRIFSCGAPFGRLGKLGTQLNLNTDTVGGICVGWPPPGEQAAIVAYLDEATASSERAIVSTGREIDLLGEYRTRLIADVVTGKLDVREAAARLPHEAEDLKPLDDTEAESETEEVDADDGDGEPEDAEA